MHFLNHHKKSLLATIDHRCSSGEPRSWLQLLWFTMAAAKQLAAKQRGLPSNAWFLDQNDHIWGWLRGTNITHVENEGICTDVDICGVTHRSVAMFYSYVHGVIPVSGCFPT